MNFEMMMMTMKMAAAAKVIFLWDLGCCVYYQEMSLKTWLNYWFLSGKTLVMEMKESKEYEELTG